MSMLKPFVLGLSLAAACISALPLTAQTAIRENAARKQWFLTAGKMSYGIGVNDQGMLQALYWGPTLAADASLPPALSNRERASFDPGISTTPLEYPAWGAGLFTEVAIKANSANGDRTLILKYDSAQVSKDQLEIVLKDTAQPVRVHLFYRVYPEGVLARWSRIENSGKTPLVLEEAASATWTLPEYPETEKSSYSLDWLSGMWAGEYQLHSERIQAGERVLESRKGSTSHRANPWFAVGRTDQTSESTGPVWFGELAWSGSWKIGIEDTSLHMVKITGGYNPFDFRCTLQPGQSLETPKFYGGYTAGGKGEASRILHRFQTDEILPLRPTAGGPPKPRAIVFNSWEATEMNFTDQTQMAMVDRAAKLGVERFVIDDGWFGDRNDDHRALGDWFLNKKKFPNGLKPLIDRVHSLGMDFGIWVEPEMVNVNSELYRQHPEWAMQLPGRQHTEQRNQLVLNLAREDVKEWMLDWLDKLVSENDIAYLKWDYNRNWSEPGWEQAPESSLDNRNPDAEKAINIRYVQNLYEVLDRLRKKHPKLEIETCSGGGGRVDLGILERTDEAWTSDNTDALDRLEIQYGFSQAYSPQVMVAWTTDTTHRAVPLQFRFLVAMQGALGVGNDITKFTDADIALSAKLVAFYKTIRTTVQHGSQYRLLSPMDGDASQVEYVSRDGKQAVLLAYLHSDRMRVAYPVIRLQGLDANAMYRVRPLESQKYRGEEVVSGSVLMGSGVRLNLRNDYDATAIVLEKL